MVLFLCVCVKFVSAVWNDFFPSVKSINLPLKPYLWHKPLKCGEVVSFEKCSYLTLSALHLADTEVSNCFLYRKWETLVCYGKQELPYIRLRIMSTSWRKQYNLISWIFFFQLKNQLLKNKLRVQEASEKMPSFTNNRIIQTRVSDSWIDSNEQAQWCRKWEEAATFTNHSWRCEEVQSFGKEFGRVY